MPELYDFQKTDVKFLHFRDQRLNYKPHKLLAHDPGVGKTPSVCYALRGRTAIILTPAPPSVKTTWAHRLIEWGAAKSHDEIQILWTGADKIDPTKRFIIVSYELCLIERLFLALQSLPKRDAFVIDECHRLQNWDAKITQHIYGKNNPAKKPLILKGRDKWLMSGTFMTNRPINMYPSFHALAPEAITPHDTYSKYAVYFCGAFFQDGEWDIRGATNLPELRDSLHNSGFMRRLELRDVYPEIPLSIDDEQFLKLDLGISKNDGEEISVRNTLGTTLELLVGIAKIPHVVSLAKDWLRQNPKKKLLIFCKNRVVTEGVRDGLKKFGAAIYYGGMTKRQKEESKRQFESGPKCRVLSANRKSAGESVDGWQYNCHHVWEAQIDWSHGLEVQGFGRVVRKGQTETVYITRFIAEGTIEEAILRSYKSKKKTFNYLFKSEDQMSEHEEVMSVLKSIDASLKKLSGAPGKPSESKTSSIAGTATAQGAGAVAGKAAKSDTAESVKGEKVTLETVRASAKELAELGKSQDKEDEVREEIVRIVKKFGKVAKIAEVKPAQCKAVNDALQTAIAEFSDEGSGEETGEGEEGGNDDY